MEDTNMKEGNDHGMYVDRMPTYQRDHHVTLCPLLMYYPQLLLSTNTNWLQFSVSIIKKKTKNPKLSYTVALAKPPKCLFIVPGFENFKVSK